MTKKQEQILEKVGVSAMLCILFCRPFGAGYLCFITRGFTPGYILSALRACRRAKKLFALHEESRRCRRHNLLDTSRKAVPHESRRRTDYRLYRWLPRGWKSYWLLGKSLPTSGTERRWSCNGQANASPAKRGQRRGRDALLEANHPEP